jgi:hypothetical protein
MKSVSKHEAAKANMTSCLSNFRQLTIAWGMHSGHNQESLVGDAHAEVWKWRKGYILAGKGVRDGASRIQSGAADARRLAETEPLDL